MRSFVSVSDRSLAERAESGLKKLGFAYLKNQGRNVTEFDVQSPCHFLVTVENMTRGQFGFPLRSRVKVESAIEFKRTIGAKESGSELKARISALVDYLCADLPDGRWKGLLTLKRMSEKASWKGFGDD